MELQIQDIHLDELGLIKEHPHFSVILIDVESSVNMSSLLGSIKEEEKEIIKLSKITIPMLIKKNDIERKKLDKLPQLLEISFVYSKAVTELVKLEATTSFCNFFDSSYSTPFSLNEAFYNISIIEAIKENISRLEVLIEPLRKSKATLMELKQNLQIEYYNGKVAKRERSWLTRSKDTKEVKKALLEVTENLIKVEKEHDEVESKLLKEKINEQTFIERLREDTSFYFRLVYKALTPIAYNDLIASNDHLNEAIMDFNYTQYELQELRKQIKALMLETAGKDSKLIDAEESLKDRKTLEELLKKSKNLENLLQIKKSYSNQVSEDVINAVSNIQESIILLYETSPVRRVNGHGFSEIIGVLNKAAIASKEFYSKFADFMNYDEDLLELNAGLEEVRIETKEKEDRVENLWSDLNVRIPNNYTIQEDLALFEKAKEIAIKRRKLNDLKARVVDQIEKLDNTWTKLMINYSPAALAALAGGLIYYYWVKN